MNISQKCLLFLVSFFIENVVMKVLCQQFAFAISRRLKILGSLVDVLAEQDIMSTIRFWNQWFRKIFLKILLPYNVVAKKRNWFCFCPSKVEKLSTFQNHEAITRDSSQAHSIFQQRFILKSCMDYVSYRQPIVILPLNEKFAPK